MAQAWSPRHAYDRAVHVNRGQGIRKPNPGIPQGESKLVIPWRLQRDIMMFICQTSYFGLLNLPRGRLSLAGTINILPFGCRSPETIIKHADLLQFLLCTQTLFKSIMAATRKSSASKGNHVRFSRVTGTRTRAAAAKASDANTRASTAFTSHQTEMTGQATTNTSPTHITNTPPLVTTHTTNITPPPATDATNTTPPPASHTTNTTPPPATHTTNTTPRATFTHITNAVPAAAVFNSAPSTPTLPVSRAIRATSVPQVSSNRCTVGRSTQASDVQSVTTALRSGLPSSSKSRYTSNCSSGQNSAKEALRSGLPSSYISHNTPNRSSAHIPANEAVSSGISNPQVTQYHDTMRSTLASLANPIETPEDTLSSIHRHRSTILRQTLRASITTGLSPSLQASLAREVKVRLKDHLLPEERNSGYVRSTLNSCGRAYWTRFHAEYEGRGAGVSQTAADPHNMYSNKKKSMAVYYWAQHHANRHYAEMVYELSLPPGLLWLWICQLCKY